MKRFKLPIFYFHVLFNGIVEKELHCYPALTVFVHGRIQCQYFMYYKFINYYGVEIGWQVTVKIC